MVVHINPEIECTEENLNVLKIASAGLEAKLKSTPLLVSFRNFEESEFKRDVEKEKYFE